MRHRTALVGRINQTKPKLMAFPTPNDSNDSNQNNAAAAEPEPEPEPESVYDTLSDEQIETLQDYWMVVDTYRGISKLCRTHLFGDGDRPSNADIAALKGQSPLADHFVFYKDAKDDMKASLREMRENGDIPSEVGLRGFKEEIEPDFEHEVLNVENAADFGVNPETFTDNDDDILIPDEYEAPTDDEGNLVVWAAESGDEVSDDEVLETLKTVNRLGDKTAEGAVEALKEAGYKVVHN
ncbi:hypothetical protein HRTV-25_gp107 [Halorubrum tailed virus 25]|uniref:Uncharacterized protein n=1 Tax=Halorubrum tailed virus 25 TaxID=2878006 RepID=A0AAE9BY34_9CAUD|nr:hypothetical protein M1M37_gp107 [Halorubrum tailed virus 25]UBF22688.1 hypothetical protein HRTV-25_gp107 [Halorubrum tailed virus 25]